MKTILVYTPKREGTAKDWSANRLIERKPKLKKANTVDEYGNGVTKLLRV